MMKKEKSTAIVLAAGQGKRMGTKVQKQFLEIDGKPILYYSLFAFQNSAIIDEIILVTGGDMIDYCKREIVEKYVKKHKQERILWELTNAKKRDGVIWKFAGKNIYMVLHHDIF